MQPGDRLLCAFVDNQLIGATFKEWPLHITIVPWFRLDIPSSELAELLLKQYVARTPFQVAVLETAQFGYKKQKLVNLVAAPELMKLEGQTRRLLHAYRAWVVDEADQTRRGFRPHITAIGKSTVRQGDYVDCNRLYIVSQHGDFKQIDSVITLD